MSELTAEDLESMDNADVDWVETVRALQAENKRLTAERDAALATTPTAHAKLAAARAAYIAAERMPGGLPDSQEWRAKFDRLHTANAALAEAEREAGVGRS